MKTDFPAPSLAPVGASMIVGALHESRRGQAINVIHRYQHLISDSVEANLGAIAFASVVILTMLAAVTFDPRLIWDNTESDDDHD